MTRSRPLKNTVGILIALASLGGAIRLAVELQDYRMRDRFAGKELIYLPSPEQARLMSLGFRQVVADYYWVKALQYFTDPAQRHNHYKNLPDYLELVVGVDPDFEYAYKFGGYAIPYDSGRLRWKNTREATALLEKGVRRFPENWSLRWLLGFNYLNFHNDPEKASEHLVVASRHPGAPAYLAGLAARVISVAGDLDGAIAFTEETLRVTGEPEVRALMEERLIDLQVEKELRRVEEAVQAFREAHGRLPDDVRELVAKTGIAPPPSGYWVDADGTAHAPFQTERMRLYQDPQQTPYEAD